MKPYGTPLKTFPGNLLPGLLLITVLVVNPAWLRAADLKPDLDAATRRGWEHFYSLEYDQAIRDFQTVVNARPDDPGAINHLLDAVLYRELYKYNALDTRLYMKQGFVTGKQVPVDPSAKKLISDLSDRAMAASEKRLKADPRDVQALYARGTTEGIRATYLVLIEKSWFSGLRSALAARHDQEEVLRLNPRMIDAETLVGAHNYVVGSLTLPVKAMAGVAGIHGDKKKGLDMLAEAGRAGGETSADARVALALFLRREEQYQKALDVVRTLTKQYPHNFLFALEEGNLLKDAGQNADAVAAFHNLLNGCKDGHYPNSRPEMAHTALADALRSLGQLQEAYQSYQAAATDPGSIPEVRQRALLGAGEVADLLAKRDNALVQYRAAIALNSSSEEADTARRYLDKPYRGR